jgi:hypothetical protein
MQFRNRTDALWYYTPEDSDDCVDHLSAPASAAAQINHGAGSDVRYVLVFYWHQRGL